MATCRRVQGMFRYRHGNLTVSVVKNDPHTHEVRTSLRSSTGWHALARALGAGWHTAHGRRVAANTSEVTYVAGGFVIARDEVHVATAADRTLTDWGLYLEAGLRVRIDRRFHLGAGIRRTFELDGKYSSKHRRQAIERATSIPAPPDLPAATVKGGKRKGKR